MRIDPPPAVLRLLLLFLITTQHEAKITTLHEASNKPYWPEDLRDIHSAALPRESPFRLPDAVLDICGAAERHRAEKVQALFQDKYFTLSDPTAFLESEAVKIAAARRKQQQRRHALSPSPLFRRDVDNITTSSSSSVSSSLISSCCLPPSLDARSAAAAGLLDADPSSRAARQQIKDCDLTQDVVRAFSFVRSQRQGCARFAAAVSADIGAVLAPGTTGGGLGGGSFGGFGGFGGNGGGRGSGSSAARLEAQLRRIEESVVNAKSGDVDVFLYFAADVQQQSGRSGGGGGGVNGVAAEARRTLALLRSDVRYPWIAAVVVEQRPNATAARALIDRCLRPPLVPGSGTSRSSSSSSSGGGLSLVESGWLTATGAQALQSLNHHMQSQQQQQQQQQQRRKKRKPSGNCSGSFLELGGSLVARRTFSARSPAEADAHCCRQCRDTPTCEAWTRDAAQDDDNGRGGRNDRSDGGGGDDDNHFPYNGGGKAHAAGAIGAMENLRIGAEFGHDDVNDDFERQQELRWRQSPVVTGECLLKKEVVWAERSNHRRAASVRTPLETDPLSRLSLSFGIAFSDNHHVSSGSGGGSGSHNKEQMMMFRLQQQQQRGRHGHSKRSRQQQQRTMDGAATTGETCGEALPFGGDGGGGDAGTTSCFGAACWRRRLLDYFLERRRAHLAASLLSRHAERIGCQYEAVASLPSFLALQNLPPGDGNGHGNQDNDNGNGNGNEFNEQRPPRRRPSAILPWDAPAQAAASAPKRLPRGTDAKSRKVQRQQKRAAAAPQQRPLVVVNQHSHHRTLSSPSPSSPLPIDVRCFVASHRSAVVGSLEDVHRFASAAFRDLRYSWSLVAPAMWPWSTTTTTTTMECRNWEGRALLATQLHWPGLWWVPSASVHHAGVV